MSKLLVIVGITGNQGSSVCKVFQNEPDWRIRGITRDPSKYHDLQKQGIELVAANLDDETSLEKAFAGANAIFAVTDFLPGVQGLALSPSSGTCAGRQRRRLTRGGTFISCRA